MEFGFVCNMFLLNGINHTMQCCMDGKIKLQIHLLSEFLVSIKHCSESMPDIFFFWSFLCMNHNYRGLVFTLICMPGYGVILLGALVFYSYYNHIFLGTLFFLVVFVCAFYLNKFKTQIKLKKVCIAHLRIKCLK